jgi:hypothetical protein
LAITLPNEGLQPSALYGIGRAAAELQALCGHINSESNDATTSVGTDGHRYCVGANARMFEAER